MGRYNIQGIPHAFVLDKDGQVAWHGHPMDPAMESAIQQSVAALESVRPKVPY
jgi:hypothetical protein